MTDYGALSREYDRLERSEPSVAELVRAAGLDQITAEDPIDALLAALNKLAAALNGSGSALFRAAVREEVGRRLRNAGIKAGKRLVDAALGPVGGAVGREVLSGLTVTFTDPEPCAELVEGAALLEEFADWIAGYIWVPNKAIVIACALWTAATWLVEEIDFAAILAVLSATKRCGKSHLLDLLRAVTRRGYLTSGTGVTTAVVFRLNDTHRPTLLIDEAEKLSGRHADRDLIGMLNAGYRRGARVARCVERNGDYAVAEFDAFGFRVLAAIGRLWDTILDRAIVIRLERKPREVKVRRFAARVVEREGLAFARRLRRWTQDHRAAVAAAVVESPRPDWLDDRACDNWSAPFAVAAVAGGRWLERALAAAQALSTAGTAEVADDTERLVHDVERLWRVEEWGEAVKSGDLTAKLNELEGSPWGECSNGKGISTHRLAKMFKELGVKPNQDRTREGQVLRGYWRTDLEPVFRRYPLPEVVPVGQPVLEEPRRDPVVPVVPLAPTQPPFGLQPEPSDARPTTPSRPSERAALDICSRCGTRRRYLRDGARCCPLCYPDGSGTGWADDKGENDGGMDGS